MAATTQTELWELAATLMGATYATEIISAASPTTPLELTMAQTYDQLRVSLLRRSDWQFARRYTRMTEAPKKDGFPSGGSAVTLEWDSSGRFDYTYRVPTESLKFRGFQRDWADTGYITKYVMRRLPLQWVTVTSSSATNGVFTFASLGGHYVYSTGSVLVEFTDTYGYEHVLVDNPSSTGQTYGFVDFNTGEDAGGTSVGTQYGISQTGFVIDTHYGDVIWNAVYPSSLDVDLAIRPTDANSWEDHILTNVSPDIYGVYTADVTDVSYMPEEFQMALAAEIAFQAGVVHAKSTKQLQLLQNQAAKFFSEAVGSSTGEEDHFDSTDNMSTAERARL